MSPISLKMPHRCRVSHRQPAYEVRPTDWRVVSASVGVLAFAGLLAGYLPTRSAARVDPVAALRAE